MKILLQLSILFIFHGFFLQAQEIQEVFDHLSLKDGLSQDTITAIIQDNQGFIWIGTRSGLNKYDGYKFTNYFHDPSNPSTISNNCITSIIKDAEGIIWIGTNKGLNRFDPRTEVFTQFYHEENDDRSLSHDIVWSLLEDRKGNLWIGTMNGLNRLDPGRDFFAHYSFNTDPSAVDGIFSLFEDSRGNVWIGTFEIGLIKWNSQTGEFNRYFHHKGNLTSLNDNLVYSIAEDKKGMLWIGTRNGLNRFDTDIQTFKHYKHNPNNPNTISHNIVNWIITDPKGILWIGTENGLDKLDPNTNKFNHFRPKGFKPQNPKNNVVYCLYVDSQENLWIGTQADGIYKYYLNVPPIQNFQHLEEDPTSLSSNTILDIYQDSNDILWIGTYGGGLNRLNPQAASFICYKHQEQEPNSISSNNIYDIFEDSQGFLWIASSQGINRLDPTTDTFICYQHQKDEPQSLSHNQVYFIQEGRNDYFWIGTNSGVDKFDSKSETFKHFSPKSEKPVVCRYILNDFLNQLWIGTHGDGLFLFDQATETLIRHFCPDDNPGSISSDIIRTIFEDSERNLWIGTFNGLNKFNRKDETFTHWSRIDGLPCNQIFGILEDDQKNLWLSTSRGLSKFNPKNGEFKNYDKQDGFFCNVFNSPYFKNREGKMYFGGSNGVISFFPSQIKDNEFKPPVIITDFYLFNNPVKMGESLEENNGFKLDQPIHLTKEIVLKYRHRVISLEFAILNYHQSHKNQFMYKLEGFDKKWIQTDYKHRRISYTNLPAGKYTFRAKGANNHGYWNEEGASIRIIITPPFWQTLWFKLLLVGLSGCFLFYIYSLQIKRLKKRLDKKLRLEMLCKKNNLSDREIEIVKLIIRGKSNNDIKDTLFISLQTVKKHIYNIFNKLGVKSRYQLITMINNEIYN